MESVALELKIWILAGVVSVLIILLGVLYSLIKQGVKTFYTTIVTKLDALIKEVQALNTKDALFERDIAETRKAIKEIKDKHEACANFKPTRR